MAVPAAAALAELLGLAVEAAADLQAEEHREAEARREAEAVAAAVELSGRRAVAVPAQPPA